ncbi:sulfite exporter TauE/SafE family protein [Rhodohalobacter sp. 614A]|uniref:sulfite exporter TauE/SafE family protein n=1 Tax=Rhodohalobacter sp. 614A TaxID=2908649 RepID=UPI001F23B052|nr:sulfite exporter TauE/SafE family protein [Rhodohalobacter sp. 614A]
MSSLKNPFRIFLSLALLLVAGWAILMYSTQNWFLFEENWFMTVTMIFGSFIAGASSEGGGAIAYPAMTLLFNIGPDVARNFSLAIQSFGMTFAAIWIFLSRIKIEKNYLLIAGLGGAIGILFGTYFIVPLIKPSYAKMMFVSFWLSFGFALWVVNFIRKRESVEQLPVLSLYQKTELLVIGVLGGIFSSVFGNGIDICTFAFVVLKYGLSEKVATPTSVILMASNAVIGALLHTFVLDTMQAEAINYLLVCLPVVIFGAPLGAFVINQIGRKTIAVLLITIIVVQFVTALIIIQPSLLLLSFSLGIFLLGMIIFFLLTNFKPSWRKQGSVSTK